MVDSGACRLVVFDFDGTVADTWHDIALALNRTLDEAGLPRVEGPRVRYWIGEGALALLARAVPAAHRSPERLDALYARFRDHYDRCCLDTTDLYPGVRECLEALSGARLAVASNKPSRFLSRIVAGLGIERYFRVILGGDALEVRKPDPRVLEHLAARAGGPASELWMIGDSAIDVELGRAAGARTIGCAWGLRGREELLAAGVDHLAEHAHEIPPLVLGRPLP
jgi:phosphoglycolate phosphatase